MNAGTFDEGVEACIAVALASAAVLRELHNWRDADAFEGLAKELEALRPPAPGAAR